MSKKTSAPSKSKTSGNLTIVSGRLSAAEMKRKDPAPVSADKVSLVLATPSYRDSFCEDYVNSILALSRWTQAQDIGLKTQFMNYADIAATRNMLLTFFYYKHTDASHMLFVDDDMGFPLQLVADCVALKADICGAFYPKRQVNLAQLHASSDLPLATATARAAGFVGQPVKNGKRRGRFAEAEFIGTGFMLISRKAIATLVAKSDTATHPTKYDGIMARGTMPNWLTLFDRRIIGGREYSEDYAFCSRWRDTGGKVWAADDCVLPHNGALKVKARYTDL